MAVADLMPLVPLPELDLFEKMSVQDSIVRDVVTLHRPLAPLDINKTIAFQFQSNENEFIKLNECELYLKIKVKIAKKNRKYNRFGMG